jgi:hypothetical protein
MLIIIIIIIKNSTINLYYKTYFYFLNLNPKILKI